MSGRNAIPGPTDNKATQYRHQKANRQAEDLSLLHNVNLAWVHLEDFLGLIVLP